MDTERMEKFRMLIAPILTDPELSKTISHALRQMWLNYFDYEWQPGMEKLAEWGKEALAMAEAMEEYSKSKELPTMIQEMPR